MIANPEDRAEAVAKLCQDIGGKLLAYYFTSGEYDFLNIIEAPSEKDVAAAVLTAMASGGATDMKTVTAMTSAEAKEVFARAGKLAGSFRPAGRV